MKPPTNVAAEIDRATVVEAPKMADPSGTAFTLQFESVLKSPDPGTAFHVASVIALLREPEPISGGHNYDRVAHANNQIAALTSGAG
jgi:hypothetical protein